MKQSPFYKQAALMLQVMPAVVREPCFALKGGTALNLFVRDMPRLSVDIDLTYLPLERRDVALSQISEALEGIAVNIQKTIPKVRVLKSTHPATRRIQKLFAEDQRVQITLEPNEVVRGTVFPCVERDLSGAAEELFHVSLSVNCLSIADLYGGKLCAALDRQHPRDLFDVKLLLENEGITEQIRKAFVVYLASHDRPMNELLNPILKEIDSIYQREFVGMVRSPIEVEELIQTRSALIKILQSSLTNDERKFLLSLKQGEPQWELLGLQGIDQLPALQWKLMNVRKIEKKKHQQAIQKLKDCLGM